MSKVFNFLFGNNVEPDITPFLEGYPKRQIVNKKHTGLYVSQEGNLPDDALPNMGIIGASGSGKTATILLNRLLSITKADRSFIIFDSDKSIYKISAGYLESIGFTIKQLDFQSQDKCKYNPIYRLNSYDIIGIQQFVNVLIDSLGGSEENSFWNAQAKTLLMLLTEALVSKQQKAPKTIETLYRWVLMCGTEKQGELDAIVLKNLSSETSRLEYISFFEAQTEKVLMTTLSVCKSALFQSKSLTKLMKEETLYFEEVREKACVIYLNLREIDIPDFAFVITLFYSQLFKFLMLPREENFSYMRVEILADEMHAFRVPKMDIIVSTIRRRLVNLVLIYQSISQIIDVYGKNASDTVLGNLSSLLVLPGVGDTTSERISKMLGSYDEDGVQTLVMNPRQVRMMKRGTALLLYGNNPAILLEKVIPWDDIKKHRNRAKRQRKGGV